MQIAICVNHPCFFDFAYNQPTLSKYPNSKSTSGRGRGHILNSKHRMLRSISVSRISIYTNLYIETFKITTYTLKHIQTTTLQFNCQHFETSIFQTYSSRPVVALNLIVRLLFLIFEHFSLGSLVGIIHLYRCFDFIDWKIPLL